MRYFISIFWPICRLEYSGMLKNKKKVLMAGGLIFGYQSTSVEVIGVHAWNKRYIYVNLHINKRYCHS